MLSRTKVAIAVLVLTAVVILFILPAFDIDPTALRASRAADLLMIALAGAAFAVFALRARSAPHLLDCHCSELPVPDLLQLTCSRLC